jgi:hypothetical protein
MEYFHLSEGPRRTVLVVVLLHKLELIADIYQKTSEMAPFEGRLLTTNFTTVTRRRKDSSSVSFFGVLCVAAHTK